MVRNVAVALILFAFPAFAFASTLETNRTIVLSEETTGNAYLAGTDITVTALQSGDVLAAGATVHIAAPLSGDAMLAGGTVEISRPIAGDVRIVGGQITIDGAIGGDLVVVGGTVTASTSAKDTRIAGGSVQLSGGSNGPVTIYASDITLSGDFKGDVTLVASDHITLSDDTHIHGVLKYNAPQQIVIPATVTIDGGASYIGSSSFLPTTQEAHTFAVAGASILFVVHLIAVLILAGLLAGLFPDLTDSIVTRALSHSTRRFTLLSLLGFALIVATPVLILILLLSFVGIAVAFLLIALYALFFMLAYVYAGVLAGAVLARALMKRSVITWKEAVIGTLVLYVIGIVPILGPLVKFILIMAAGGSIASIAYVFAFRRTQEELPFE